MSFKIEKSWVTQAGLPAVVIWINNSHRCGYVELTKDSVFYGVTDEREVQPITQKSIDDFDVHGGVTFFDRPYWEDSTTENFNFFVGFDCAHAGDATMHSPAEGVLRSLDYCIEECESLAKQLMPTLSEESTVSKDSVSADKPEVVAYLHSNKENPEHRGVSLFHDKSCTNTLVNTEPLIRLSDYEALQAENDTLRAKTSLSLGVGDSTGNLFVHGDYDSIKRVQELIFKHEKLRRHVSALVEALAEARHYVVTSSDIVRGNFIQEIDEHIASYHNGGEL